MSSYTHTKGIQASDETLTLSLVQVRTVRS